MLRSIVICIFLFTNLAKGQNQNSQEVIVLRSPGSFHFILGLSGVYGLRTGLHVYLNKHLSIEGAVGYVPSINIGGPDESLTLVGGGINGIIFNRKNNAAVLSILFCRAITWHTSSIYNDNILVISPMIGVNRESESGSGLFVRFGPVLTIASSTIRSRYFTIDGGWSWTF